MHGCVAEASLFNSIIDHYLMKNVGLTLFTEHGTLLKPSSIVGSPNVVKTIDVGTFSVTFKADNYVISSYTDHIHLLRALARAPLMAACVEGQRPHLQGVKLTIYTN